MNFQLRQALQTELEDVQKILGVLNDLRTLPAGGGSSVGLGVDNFLAGSHFRSNNDYFDVSPFEPPRDPDVWSPAPPNQTKSKFVKIFSSN